MRTVGRAGASEPIDELRAHVFTAFEALAANMGAEVDVRTGRRRAQAVPLVKTGQQPHGIFGYPVHHAPPTRMHDRETPARRYHDNGNAIGVAEKGGHVRCLDGEAVRSRRGLLASTRDGFGGAAAYAHDAASVNLARHDEVFGSDAERLGHDRAVARNEHGIVAYMVAEVERSEGPLACTPRAFGERDAHADRFEQRFVGDNLKRRKTTLGQMRQWQLKGRFHDT